MCRKKKKKKKKKKQRRGELKKFNKMIKRKLKKILNKAVLKV
jgi:hypothetical protein